MSSKQTVLRVFAGAITASAMLFFASRLPAGFSTDDQVITIEIEGVNYGRLDHVSGLDQLYATAQPEGGIRDFAKVTVRRDFVTDPSLYLWAKNLVSRHDGLRDVHLVTSSADGQELRRSVLKLCQPLSWTLESANAGLGGFHETIELAVQNIATY